MDSHLLLVQIFHLTLARDIGKFLVYEITHKEGWSSGVIILTFNPFEIQKFGVFGAEIQN